MLSKVFIIFDNRNCPNSSIDVEASHYSFKRYCTRELMLLSVIAQKSPWHSPPTIASVTTTADAHYNFCVQKEPFTADSIDKLISSTSRSHCFTSSHLRSDPSFLQLQTWRSVFVFVLNSIESAVMDSLKKPGAAVGNTYIEIISDSVQALCGGCDDDEMVEHSEDAITDMLEVR